MSNIVVYSAQESGFEPGFAYRNPRFFRKPLGSHKKIIVVGNWPNVVEAYKALGVTVEVVAPGLPLRPAGELPAPPLRHPLDHDGDGRPGGSPKQPASDDLAALRQQYRDKFGKAPFNGWKADTLREKLAAGG